MKNISVYSKWLYMLSSVFARLAAVVAIVNIMIGGNDQLALLFVALGVAFLGLLLAGWAVDLAIQRELGGSDLLILLLGVVGYCLTAGFLAYTVGTVCSAVAILVKADEQTVAKVGFTATSSIALIELAILIFVIRGIYRASKASEDSEVR